MKEKFESLGQCEGCTLEQFEEAFAEDLQQHEETRMVSAQLFGRLKVVRFIRKHWDTLVAASGGNISELFKFIAENFDEILEIISGDDDFLVKIGKLIELINDYREGGGDVSTAV